MVKRASSTVVARPRKRTQANKAAYIPRIVGRGNYWTSGTARRILSGIGGAAGGLIGGMGGAAAGPAGALMGGTAGLSAGYGAAQTIGNILGMGDYAVQYNSLVPMKMGHPVPAFGDMSSATIIRHREWLKDVVVPGAPGTFTNDLFVINPGNTKTFPWLSKIAAHYDQYQFMGLVFHFKSTAGDTASFALGSVILATDYDVSDPAFASKNEMEQSQFCVSAKATQDQIHPIECDPTVGFVPIKYIDHGISAQTGFEKRCSDHGNFQIATVALPAGTSGGIGELWVSYEVALYKPQVFDAAVAAVLTGGLGEHFRIPAGFTSASPLGLISGTGPVRSAGGNLGVTTMQYLGTDWALLFPVGLLPGKYWLQMTWIGASTALTNAVDYSFLHADTGTAATEFGNYNLFIFGTATRSRLDAGVTSTQQATTIAFQLTNTLQRQVVLLITAGTMPGTPTVGDITISRVPDALVG